MWIAARLVLALIGFVIRQLSRRQKPTDPEQFEGKPYFTEIRRNKRSISGFKIGMVRRSPTWIRMHGENSVDRLFKRLRLAREIQTGDPEFDDLVYVTCDHPYVGTMLAKTPRLRDAIARAFDDDYDEVVFDGSTVWLTKSASGGPPMKRDLRLLSQVHAASSRLEDGMPSRLADRFLWKAFVVEGLVYSLSFYALGAFLEYRSSREDYHLFPGQVVALGLLLAAAILVVVLAVVVLWLRGSSRGPGLIFESVVLLPFVLPIAGIQIASDSNRALDAEPPALVVRQARACEARGRRPRRYHLSVEPERMAPVPELPADIRVTWSLCNAIEPGTQITFEIGPGRWGIPWYRRISARAVTWRAF